MQIVVWIFLIGYALVGSVLFMRQADTPMEFIAGLLLLACAVAAQVFTFRNKQTPIEAFGMLLKRRKQGKADSEDVPRF